MFVKRIFGRKQFTFYKYTNTLRQKFLPQLWVCTVKVFKILSLSNSNKRTFRIVWTRSVSFDRAPMTCCSNFIILAWFRTRGQLKYKIRTTTHGCSTEWDRSRSDRPRTRTVRKVPLYEPGTYLLILFVLCTSTYLKSWRYICIYRERAIFAFNITFFNLYSAT